MLHGHFYSENNNKDILIDVTRIVQEKHWYFDTNFIMMRFRFSVNLFVWRGLPFLN